jgi:hypothetical protein
MDVHLRKRLGDAQAKNKQYFKFMKIVTFHFTKNIVYFKPLLIFVSNIIVGARFVWVIYR